MILHGALSVLRFELKRSLTSGRIAGWAVLVLFPILIVSVVKHYEPTLSDTQLSPESLSQLWGMLLFGLIPEVICLFGLLLWATPVVQAELEGKTWIYLAVRPHGRVTVLLGKYMAALVWTIAAGWLSGTICVLIASPPDLQRLWITIMTAVPIGDVWAEAIGGFLRLWLVIMALVALSSLAYGALYCLLGALFHRRAMVIAVAYTLIFEFLISLIPAVINKLTVQYRLRNLLFSWMQWDANILSEAKLLLGEEPTSVHLAILCGVTIALLLAATQVIQKMEYVTADEG